jgi:hypothetical protein
MELTKALAAIANQLKEQGADHGTIVLLQKQIDGIDEEIDTKIKEALAGFAPPTGDGTFDPTALNNAISDLQEQINVLKTRMDNAEQGIEDLGGDADEPPVPVALAVSPSTLSLTVGAAASVTLAVTGGTAPYAFSSSLADISVDASGAVTGTPAAAETGTITVTDSGSPALVETVPVTVA